MMGSKALSRDSTKKTLRCIYYSLKIWGESLLYGLLQTPRALSFHCGIFLCAPGELLEKVLLSLSVAFLQILVEGW